MSGISLPFTVHVRPSQVTSISFRRWCAGFFACSSLCRFAWNTRSAAATASRAACFSSAGASKLSPRRRAWCESSVSLVVICGETRMYWSRQPCIHAAAGAARAIVRRNFIFVGGTAICGAARHGG